MSTKIESEVLSDGLCIRKLQYFGIRGNGDLEDGNLHQVNLIYSHYYLFEYLLSFDSGTSYIIVENKKAGGYIWTLASVALLQTFSFFQR